MDLINLEFSLLLKKVNSLKTVASSYKLCNIVYLYI